MNKNNKKNFLKIKENNRDYLLVNMTGAIDNFAVQMLMYRESESFIPFRIRQHNEKVTFFYDITGKVSLQEIFAREGKRFSLEEVIDIARSFDNLFKDCKNKMLDLNKILLQAANCYLDIQSKKYSFVYMPQMKGKACDINLSLRNIWSKIVEKVDNNGQVEGLIKVYELFQKVSSGSLDIDNLFANLLEESKETNKRDIYEDFKQLSKGKETISLQRKEEDQPFTEEELLWDREEVAKISDQIEKEENDNKASNVVKGIFKKKTGRVAIIAGLSALITFSIITAI